MTRALDIRTAERSLAVAFSDLEFPPEGIVSREWADGVESLRLGFGQLLDEWGQIEAPPGFEAHHDAHRLSLEAELTLADAMFAWIGIGANRDARQERIDAYDLAKQEVARTRQLSDAALDEATSIDRRNPESVELFGAPVTLSDLIVSDISSRVTDHTESRWQFAWKVTAQNLRQSAVKFSFTVSWLDSGGFIVDSANEFDRVLAPAESETFSGVEQINLPAAYNVSGVSIDIIQAADASR